jgi:predicted GNAT family acetyltransferase
MFYVVIWAIPFAVIGLLLAVTACSAGTPTSSTPSHPTTQSLAQRVDQAVAGDGTPLDLSGNSTALGYYPDAYALIKSDCDTMTSQTSGAAQWLAQHLGSSYAVSGEQAALAVGVPLVCPSFTQALTDSQSIAPVGVEKWTAQDTQFVTDVEAHVHDMVLDPQHPVDAPGLHHDRLCGIGQWSVTR